MAFLTQANAAAFGHQGAEGRKAFLSTSMPKPVSLGHCFLFDVKRGWPSGYFPLTGSLPSAAAEVEGTAATPSALSTPTGTTLTPAAYVVSLSVSDWAHYRSLEVNDPTEIAKMFAAYAAEVYLMKDNTVGLSEVFGTVTASGGNTGAALLLDGILDAAEDVRVNSNDSNLVVTAMIDGKGQSDVQDDILTNASAIFGNPSVSATINAALADRDAMLADIETGYWFSPDGKTAICVEGGYDMLDQNGGDRIGCAFLSPSELYSRMPGVRITSESQRGPRQIAPAFALAVNSDPASASSTQAIRYETVDTVAGPVKIVERAFTGAGAWTIDVFGSGDVALVRDNSASKILYLA